MTTLYQSPENRKLSISEFTYDPITRKFFRYGLAWKRCGIDALVDPVEHDGQLIRASEWLKLHAVDR